MSKSAAANINFKLLEWARKSAKYEIDLAAQKLAITPQKLQDWESNTSSPSIAQLRKIGALYKRPIAVFYLSETPQDFQPLHDYRRFPGKVAGTQSPELCFEIRKAYDRRDIALDIATETEALPPKFLLKATLNDDPETIALKIRQYLGITFENQIELAAGYPAFNFWKDALEEQGILVFQTTEVEEREVRGFSIANTLFPVVVANMKDSPQARTFTIMHEFCHLMLREGGLCDLSEDARRKPEEQKVEIFCNKVAGATLVPGSFFLNEQLVKSEPENWDDSKLRFLANRYGVSRDVILYRLLTHDLITKIFYQEKFASLQLEYAKKKAEMKEKMKTAIKKGFMSPAVEAVSSLGRPFSSLVMDGYSQNKITAADVSDYLGVRLKHLEKIKNILLDNKKASK